MQSEWLTAAGAWVAATFAWWSQSSVHCSCDCIGRGDHPAFTLLREQLQRCGPEQLTQPTCLPPPPLVSSGLVLIWIFSVSLAFGAGVLFASESRRAEVAIAARSQVLHLRRRHGLD